MAIRYDDMHEITGALMIAVLEELTVAGQAPVFAEYVGQDGWSRSSQETLMVIRRQRWRHPMALSSPYWWEQLPQMRAFRTVLASHPELSSRVDTLIGFDFSAQRRDLQQLLIVDLLTPLVEAARDYVFDRTVFDVAYERVEAGLLAENVRWSQIVPLLGFDMAQRLQVDLGDGLVIRLMTDVELSAAVQAGLPDQASFGTLSREVSRLYQCAVIKVTTYPIRAGETVDHVVRPASIADDASRVQIALRLVCGGSVTTGRLLEMQHPDDFPATHGYSVSRSWSDAPDLDRPTLLLDPVQVTAVQRMMVMLADPAITGNRPLQLAIRRLMWGGSRDQPEDRLIDLTIAAEALFIHGKGSGGKGGKSAPIAAGAEALLAGDHELGVPAAEISSFVTHAYKRRNHEVHADPGTFWPLNLLDGSQAPDLRSMVNDLERLICRAVALTIHRSATSLQLSP
ncbi:hypothetical protein [Herbidospora cretacea]|uniref:hypothetical protein n=1 Tax=Herbidospora cretacea TaxID=28444 RepID=UPI000774E58B|nr:hypothetical protein [Herbidospora cretacea]